MNANSNLDREPFQQLLASAFAVQKSQVDSRSLSAITEIQRLIASGELDLDGTMHRVVELARAVANASGVAIGVLKGDQLIYRAANGTALAYAGRRVTASLTVSADSQGSREILRVENAQTDTRIEAAICRQFGANSLLILPVYHAHALAGVLEILFSEAHIFPDCEVRTYRLMAKQVEAAISKAAQPEPQKSPAAEPQVDRPRVVQITSRRQQAFESLASLPSRSLRWPAYSDRARPWVAQAIAKVSPALKRAATHSKAALQRMNSTPWLDNRRNLMAVAVVTVILCIGWIAFAARRSSLESSALPATVVDHTGTSADKPLPGKLEEVNQPVSGNTAGPRIRRVRVGKDEVEYIGDDVTVRYFRNAVAPPKRQNAQGRVIYLGDDVTVRYFVPTAEASHAR